MVSQTVEYALRAMSHLASLQGRSATSEVLAQATLVPHAYLSKIMRDLVCADLVKSFRGRRGGFLLAREPREISLLDIVNAVEPIRRIQRCPLGNPLHVTLCSLHQCLDDVLAHAEHLLARTTLDTVLDESCRPGMCRSLVGQKPLTQPGVAP